MNRNVSGITLPEAEAWRKELLGPKSNKPLSLSEILYAGEKRFFGGANLIRLFGMEPQEYHERGVRIVGRTVIECKVDKQASFIANKVGEVIEQHFSVDRPIVVDIFTGSGNLLYHVASVTEAVLAVGFERDKLIYELTKQNFKRINFPATLYHGKFQSLFDPASWPNRQSWVILVDPPWGDKGAFSFTKGLDLRLTTPPIPDILDSISLKLASRQVVYVIPIYKLIVEESLAEIRQRYKVYARGVTDCPSGTTKMGYLICGMKTI